MKKYSVVLIVILLGLFVTQAVGFIWNKSPMHDDSNWVTIAWYLTHHWTWQGDYHVLMHPPLTFYVHGLPLWLLELWMQDPLAPPPEGELALQNPYPYSEILKYDTVFTIAKLSILSLAILLGWYIYRWAAQLYGISAGLFALSLFVFNPFLIAYATILSTDMAIACFMFITLYYSWKFAQNPSPRHSVLTGIMLGLALLTRVSAVLLFPVFGILALLVFLYRRYRHKGTESASVPENPSTHETKRKVAAGEIPRKYLIGAVFILCLALLLLEAGYLFDMQPVRAFRPEQEDDLLYRAFQNIPIPFGAYINNIRLHQSFLFWVVRNYLFAGQFFTEPVWYYNFYAMVLKNPVPLSVLLLLSVWMWPGSMQRFIKMEIFLVVPALFLFLYFSFFFPVVDFRFALPVYPFVFVWISRVVTWNVLQKTSGRIILSALLVWYILSTASAFPHYLAYCNELGGGLHNSAYWFSFDSGQDLKGLGRYIKQNHIPEVKLAYHGTGIPEYYGVRYIPLREPEACSPATGMFAISISKLQGLKTQDPDCYEWLHEYEPVDLIGYTILIYAIKGTR